MNRVRSFLPHCCPGCRDKRRLENRLDHVREAVAEIESEVGTDVFEFVIPRADMLLSPRVADDEFDDVKRGVRIFITVESELADLSGDVRQFAIMELRRMAHEILAVAGRLEGGVSE